MLDLMSSNPTPEGKEKSRIESMPVKKMKEKCPKCGMPLLTDDDTVWCSNDLCDYEWFP